MSRDRRPRSTLLLVGLLLVAVALLTGPLWVGAFQLDADRTVLESFEVTVSNGTIDYAAADHPEVRISEELGCGPVGYQEDHRRCVLEEHAVETDADPVFLYSSTPEFFRSTIGQDYAFIQVAGGVYRPDISTDDEFVDRSDGPSGYPTHLAHERVDPEQALFAMALPIDDVDGAVQSAARTGETVTIGDVSPPATVIRLEDDTVRRVVAVDRVPPTQLRADLAVVGRSLAPVVGLVLLGVAGWRYHAGRYPWQRTDP